MANRFHTLYFETTRNCNFSCKYCSTGSNTKEKFKDISFDKIVKYILKPAYELGTRFIDFSGGEFLLRKDAFDILRKAHEMGFILGIASNGSTLSDKNLNIIKSIVGDNMIISLGINTFDLKNKETRDVETEFTLKLIEKIQKYNFRINLCVTIGEFNKHSFANTVENIKALALPYNRIPIVPRSCDIKDLMINKESLKEYFHPSLRKYFNGQISYAPYMLPPEVYKEITGQDLDKDQITLSPSVGCWVGSYYGINPEGEVSPCPLFSDHVTGGNVLETPLSEILFESELFVKIVDRKNLEGKCGNCKYTNTCGGCRVMAYYYTGNVYAEDPTCFLNDLSEKEIQEIENDTIKSFKNYVRMTKLSDAFRTPLDKKK